MILTSLMVCADEAAVLELRRVLEELNIHVELCADPVRAAVRLAQERFDLIILDCKKQADVISLLNESHSSRVNGSSLAVVVVEGQESIREMFSLGVNFVLYKPGSYERALSTLRAAPAVLVRDKRRKAPATVRSGSGRGRGWKWSTPSGPVTVHPRGIASVREIRPQRSRK